MLLVIHNLPKTIRYEEIKDLIRNRCDLTDIIVDNFMLETTTTRKVTIGLADESDAAVVFKELDGLVLRGKKLCVEDLRKKKDSGNQHKPFVQDNNMPAQFASYNFSSGNNYPFNGMGDMQNTEIPSRGVQSPYEHIQQQVGGSTAPDFIPFNSGMTKYDGGRSDRYFNWDDKDQRQTSDVRARPSYSNDENYPDLYHRRSDNFPKCSNSDNDGNSSMQDPYRWDKGDDRGRNDEEAGSQRVNDNYPSQYDRRRGDDSYDSSAKRPKFSHFEEPSTLYDFGSGYSENRENYRGRIDVPDRGYHKRSEQPPFRRAQDIRPLRRATNPRIQRRDQPKSFPPPISFAPPQSFPPPQSFSQPQSFPTPKGHKNIDNQDATKNKDETWRGQAVSAIVKNLLTENGMFAFVKKQRFLNHIKPTVRSQINKMLGKRVAVPPARILEEYKSRNRLIARVEFIYDERKKYEFMKYEAGDIPKDLYDATVAELNGQLALKRRALKPSNLSKKLKKPLMPKKVVKTPTPVNVLPKYPNNDKKELNRLKRLEKNEPGVYDHKLDPKLRSALDKELGILCDLAREECLKAEDVDEKNIATRIMDTIKFFREQVNLHVCKRLLNITKNLPMRVFTQEKVNSKEVKEQLKSLGIATFRKCLGKNKYVATCRTFEQYDHFCAQATFDINGQKLTFRPMHSGRLAKKKKEVEKKADADIEKYDDSEDDGNESDDDGADELESYEDDEEICEESKALDSVAEIESVIDIKSEEVPVKLKTEEENKSNDAKEAVLTEEKIDKVENEMDNVETAELRRDITALSNIIYGSIDNEGNVDNVKTVDNEESVGNGNIDGVKVDNLPNIDQDDLEDF